MHTNLLPTTDYVCTCSAVLWWPSRMSRTHVLLCCIWTMQSCPRLLPEVQSWGCRVHLPCCTPTLWNPSKFSPSLSLLLDPQHEGTPFPSNPLPHTWPLNLFGCPCWSPQQQTSVDAWAYHKRKSDPGDEAKEDTSCTGELFTGLTLNVSSSRNISRAATFSSAAHAPQKV